MLKFFSRAALLLGLTGPALAEPALDRITLSTGGVGQFEFIADVDGAATLPLVIPLDQVDDLLKSLRVDDAAGPSTLRMPGRQPLAESFRPLPFGPDAFASTEALLGALVGEAVRVGGVDGRILAVAPFEAALPEGRGTTTRHRLTIATAAGIETAVLQDTPAVAFASATLRDQIGTALAAIAAQRVQDRRTAQLTLAAGGRRSVRFGYVMPVPVWKAAYRLTSAEAPAGSRLQGFAVVENLSGQDWSNVEVRLTSGQPVLFHQPLYEAVFATRPEAPVDIPNRIVPRLDPGATLLQDEPAPPPPAAPLPEAPGPMRSQAARPRVAMAPAPPPADVRQSVAQVEFRLADRVSAASGETMLLPILDRTMPAVSVALFQADTDARHPLVAMLLTNDTGGALPPGLVTLFEPQADGPASFVGDARLPTVPPGEARLISFAADLAVTIDTTRDSDVRITTARAARGVLEVVSRETATTRYRVTTPATSGRTVVIEQPRRDGWSLVDPTAAGQPAITITQTPGHTRLMRTVAAATTQTIEVTLERPRSERLVLTETATARLLAVAQEGRLSPELRTALTRAAGLRAELDRRQAVVRGIAERRGSIVADQDRLRQNLGAVPANSELARRYLAQLQQQETQLDALRTQADAAQRAAEEADTAQKEFLAALAL